MSRCVYTTTTVVGVGLKHHSNTLDLQPSSTPPPGPRALPSAPLPVGSSYQIDEQTFGLESSHPDPPVHPGTPATLSLQGSRGDRSFNRWRERSGRRGQGGGALRSERCPCPGTYSTVHTPSLFARQVSCSHPASQHPPSSSPSQVIKKERSSKGWKKDEQRKRTGPTTPPRPHHTIDTTLHRSLTHSPVPSAHTSLSVFLTPRPTHRVIVDPEKREEVSQDRLHSHPDGKKSHVEPARQAGSREDGQTTYPCTYDYECTTCVPDPSTPRVLS